MKPDQHKQKKNAAYKKKHGISCDKQPNGKGALSTCDRRGDKDSSKGSEMEHKTHGHQTLPKERINGHLTNSSKIVSRTSNELEHESEVNCSTFARRKIESNWKKYEIDIDAEEETLRGADYSELLLSRSSILPEFEFGRCNSVCEEPLICDSGSAWWEKYLSLDCDHLAAAFQCIPLHRRLDIDESLFKESQLKMFKQNADSHVGVYHLKFGSRDARNPSRKTTVSSDDTAASDQIADLTFVEHNVAAVAAGETDNTCEDKSSPSSQPMENRPRESGHEISASEDTVRCSKTETFANSETSVSVENTVLGGALNAASQPRTLSENINEILVTDSSTDGTEIPSCTKTGGSLNEKSITELEDELESLLAL